MLSTLEARKPKLNWLNKGQFFSPQEKINVEAAAVLINSKVK